MEERKRETVFVTGASAGVGRAVAREFAAHGANIGLYARDMRGEESARAEVESLGGRALILRGDVADWGRLDWCAGELEKEFGPIDVWVNNAMTTVFSPFVDITPDEFRRVTEVTYLGYVHGTLAALRRMKPRNRGSIVQVSSVLAYRSIPLQSAYCGAKHAIKGFTDSVRSELMHDKSKVRLSEVLLPAVNTPQFDWCLDKMGRQPQPIPPIYDPEAMAKGVYWAAHHARRELTIGLRSEAFIWGDKLFPGIGDRYLASHGYSGQMTKEQVPPGRPSNLWNPVDTDPGVRGRFDGKAWKASKQLWVMTHLGISWLVAAAAAAAAAAGCALFSRLRSSRPA